VGRVSAATVVQGNEEAVLSITLEDPAGPDAASLLTESDAYSALLYPPESRHQPDIALLSAANVRFFVARLGKTAVGCSARVIGDAGTAELKLRMPPVRKTCG